MKTSNSEDVKLGVFDMFCTMLLCEEYIILCFFTLFYVFVLFFNPYNLSLQKKYISGWHECSPKRWRKIMRNSILAVLMALVIATFASGCFGGYSGKVLYNDSLFREGDLVLRMGNGAESHLVTTVSEGMYSHVGMLHYDSVMGWTVVHVVPGETPDDEIDVVKVEPIDSFFMPMKASRGAVAQLDCSRDVARKAVQYAINKAKARVPFDNDYRLSDTTELYCTELVWRSYLSQGVDLTEGMRSELPAFSTDGVYIMPTDILDAGHVTKCIHMESIEDK